MSPSAPGDIGRTLSALADADADTGNRPESRPPAAVVAETRDTFQSLSTATRFLSDGDELTLRRAVGEAIRRGHHDCARHGRSLPADLDRLHVALVDAGTAEAPNRSFHATEGRPRDADHFRSGRTAVFNSGGELSDR